MYKPVWLYEGKIRQQHYLVVNRARQWIIHGHSGSLICHAHVVTSYSCSGEHSGPGSPRQIKLSHNLDCDGDGFRPGPGLI